MQRIITDLVGSIKGKKVRSDKMSVSCFYEITKIYSYCAGGA